MEHKQSSHTFQAQIGSKIAHSKPKTSIEKHSQSNSCNADKCGQMRADFGTSINKKGKLVLFIKAKRQKLGVCRGGKKPTLHPLS